jgi:NADH-quinone oxidoreductase subunit J
MTPDLIVFFALATVSVASAVMMIASGNAIYSALFLVVNFFTAAAFYLLLAAPFIALVQVSVYAGAIMVLFLFVIMLLGAERVETSPSLPLQAPVAVAMGFALMVVLGYGLLVSAGSGTGLGLALSDTFGSPRQVGELLFDQYLLPFEVTSLLLLVAMVGAIVLTREERKEGG